MATRASSRRVESSNPGWLSVGCVARRQEAHQERRDTHTYMRSHTKRFTYLKGETATDRGVTLPSLTSRSRVVSGTIRKQRSSCLSHVDRAVGQGNSPTVSATCYMRSFEGVATEELTSFGLCTSPSTWVPSTHSASQSLPSRATLPMAMSAPGTPSASPDVKPC